MIDCINDEDEEPIVRHEVLVALGDIVDNEKYIEPFCHNKD